MTKQVLQKEKEQKEYRNLENPKPALNYKVRDYLQINGKRIPFSDIITFVKKEDLYLPVCCCEDVKEDDIKFDMSSFLSIGLSELIAVYLTKRDPNMVRDIEDLFKRDEYDYEDCMRILGELRKDVVDKNPLGIPLSMTTRYVDYRYEWIRQYARSFYILSMLSQKDFITAFMTCVDKLYYTGLPFLRGFEENDSIYCPELFEYPKSARTFGRIPFSVNGEEYSISDCRGLGIYATLIVMYSIYGKLGGHTEELKRIIGKTEYSQSVPGELENLTNGFRQCIGDDFVGKYLQNGRFRIRTTSEEMAYYSLGHFRMTNSGQITINRIPKEQYENKILFQEAHGVGFTETDRLGLDDTGIHYLTLPELRDVLLKFMDTKDLIHKSEYEKLERENGNEIRRLTDENKRLNTIVKDRIETKAKETAAEETEKLLEAKESRIKELEYQLSVKSDIVSNLSQELKAEKEKTQNMFSEDELDEELTEEALSLEEMIDYLNQFRILMVGGRIGLLGKLADIGWTNVDQVMKENAIGGQVDFYCIHTRFVSHTIISLAESTFPDQRSQMLYYNGTNIEKLVHVCYHFVKNWVN